MSSEWFCCDKCSKSFGTRGRYNQHLKTHSRPFRCEPCQRGFALRRDLDRHRNARHRVGHEPLRCPYNGFNRKCDFQSNRKDNLARHLRNFHRDKSAASNGEVRQGTVTDGDHSPSPGSSTALMSIDSHGQFYSLLVFMQAATIGNIDILDACLSGEIDIHSKAKDGSTALHCAARAGQTATVKYLIKSGARTEDMNAKDRTPLEEAIIGRNAETVETLLDASSTVKIGYRVEAYLARSESFEIIQMYIERLPKVPRGALMHRIFTATLRSGQKALAANLLKHPDLPKRGGGKAYSAPIHEAVRYGQVEALSLLLESEEIDVNSTTRKMYLTPLHLAASRGHHEIVEILLKHPSILINPRTIHGHLPLHLAAEQSHAKVVGHLLNRNDIDVNSTGDNISPIPPHLSVRNSYLEVVKLLLARDNSAINDQDSSGRTPLHLAVSSGRLEVVKFLLSQDGIGINYTNKWDETPLYLASSGGRSKAMKLLLYDTSIRTRRKDRKGQSALHIAAFKEHWEVVSMLLDHWEATASQVNTSKPASTGDPIDKSEQLKRLWKHPDFEDIKSRQYSGDTLLHRCVTYGGLSILQSVLGREEVDVNVVNDAGRSLLYLAIFHRRVEAARLLLQHKDIDINRGDIYIGETPLGYARCYRLEEIVDLLLSHGALDQDYISPMRNYEGPSIERFPFTPTTVEPEYELETQPHILFNEYMADLEENDLTMDDISDTEAAAWSMSGEEAEY